MSEVARSFEDFMQLCEIAAAKDRTPEWVVERIETIGSAKPADMLNQARYWVSRFSGKVGK